MNPTRVFRGASYHRSFLRSLPIAVILSLNVFSISGVSLSQWEASQLLAAPVTSEAQKVNLVEITPDQTKNEKKVFKMLRGGKVTMVAIQYINGDEKFEWFRHHDGTLERRYELVKANKRAHIVTYQLDGKRKLEENTFEQFEDTQVVYAQDGTTAKVRRTNKKLNRATITEHFDAAGKITLRHVEVRAHGQVPASKSVTVFAANEQEDYTWTAVPGPSGDLVLNSVSEQLGKGRKRVISFVGNTPSSATYFDANGAIEKTEAFDKLSVPFDMARIQEPKP